MRFEYTNQGRARAHAFADALAAMARKTALVYSTGVEYSVNLARRSGTLLSEHKPTHPATRNDAMILCQDKDWLRIGGDLKVVRIPRKDPLLDLYALKYGDEMIGMFLDPGDIANTVQMRRAYTTPLRAFKRACEVLGVRYRVSAGVPYKAWVLRNHHDEAAYTTENQILDDGKWVLAQVK